MNILAISDYYRLGDRINILTKIIEEYNIDVITLVGGLFSENNTDIKIKGKKWAQERKRKNEANNIKQLNWLLKPVIVIPSPSDLGKKQLIKQVQAQDTINIRFINNKSTLLDNWLFLGLTSNLSSISEYLPFGEDKLVVIYTGSDKPNLEFNKELTIISKVDLKSNNYSGFIVPIDSLEKNVVTLIDLDVKSVNSISI